MNIRFIFFSCLILAFSAVQAQKEVPDHIKTNKGLLTIQPVLHGTLAMQWNGKTIYVDPYGGADAFSGIDSPDIILLTDIHGDHLDLLTLEAIETSKAVIIAPQAVADKLPEYLKQKTVVLDNGDKVKQSGMTIEAIPMYNLPETEDSRHPKGRGNGYVLTLGNKRVYVSGDTEDIREMRNLKNIDVAFISMNLPYTMDIDQAASAVLEFRPKIIYPYHFRGEKGLSDVEAFKKKVTDSKKNIDVRLRNWYPTK
jgi:L-ascorbate metabolism protein UlaG (beta-lactamase superfamily)